MSKPTLEHLKMVASIIEFRCNNIKKVKELLELDIANLYSSRSQKIRDKICLDIYTKLEYIEILLSKNVDDIMSLEIMDIDSNSEKEKPFKLSELLKEDEKYTDYIQ